MSVDVETVKQTVGEGGGFFSNRRNVILTAGAIGVGIGAIIFLTRRNSPADGNSSKMADLSGLPVFVNSLAEQLMRFRGEQSIAEQEGKVRETTILEGVTNLKGQVGTSETNIIGTVNASGGNVINAVNASAYNVLQGINASGGNIINAINSGNANVIYALGSLPFEAVFTLAKTNAERIELYNKWFFQRTGRYPGPGENPYGGAGGFEYMNPLDWLRAGKPFADPTVAYLPSDYTDDQLDAGDGSGAQWFTIVSATKPTRRAAFHG
jgi:hypothetical protein